MFLECAFGYYRHQGPVSEVYVFSPYFKFDGIFILFSFLF